MTDRRPNIVVNKHTPGAVEVFSRLGEVTALASGEVTRDVLGDTDLLVVRSETRVDRKLLDGTPVRFVGTVTIGTDHVDLEYLASRGIAFASAPGSNANSVAEYVVAALLVWSGRTGIALRGRSIGVVGVGNVGSRVAAAATALGMETILNDPPLARLSGGAGYSPLDEALAADIVTLHVPLTRSGPDATYHLIDGTRIGMINPGALLVNTSRGAVVRGDALTAALGARRIAGAVLDVWEHEPAIDNDLLNLVALGTPHCAGYSLDGKLNAVSMVYGAACRFLGVPEGLPPGAEEHPAPRRIAIPEGASAEPDVLSHAVTRAYDIAFDDRNLRRLMTLPPAEQPAYFARLRSEYRVRREFPQWTCVLAPPQGHMEHTLRRLGFRTERAR